MPNKKKSASTPAKKVTKSAYVRALPSTLSAKEVVAKAKKDGINISIVHVYKVRSAAKPRKGKAGRPGPGAAARREPPAPRDAAEAKVRVLIGEVGLARARRVFAEIEAAFRG
jgi:hypothetical protein